MSTSESGANQDAFLRDILEQNARRVEKLGRLQTEIQEERAKHPEIASVSLEGGEDEEEQQAVHVESMIRGLQAQVLCHRATPFARAGTVVC